MPATPTPTDDAIRVYWQPGCTSCLRTKEFLERHRVPYLSRNVLAEEGARAELARFGLKQVPVVTRGGRWADGQVLKDVAGIAGIVATDHVPLPVAELGLRLDQVLAGARRLTAQIPEPRLGDLLANRPRSYADLAYHVFNIADAFLEHDAGIPLVFDAYNRVPSPEAATRAGLLAYAGRVQSDLAAWWAGPGAGADWQRPAAVYYGRQTLHEFLERTTWHAGQHTRQLASLLADTLGIAPDRPPGPETWAGLPMPREVWDS
jgi:glutaredoxin